MEFETFHVPIIRNYTLSRIKLKNKFEFFKTFGMAKSKTSVTITEEGVVNKIYMIRGRKIMLDRDLADLYGVQTRILNQAVRRNAMRFPSDFMFSLTEAEFRNLISQSVISSWGGSRKLPLAFTEQGVAMLSSVLNSKSAIEVNI